AVRVHLRHALTGLDAVGILRVREAVAVLVAAAGAELLSGRDVAVAGERGAVADQVTDGAGTFLPGVAGGATACIPLVRLGVAVVVHAVAALDHARVHVGVAIVAVAACVPGD